MRAGLHLCQALAAVLALGATASGAFAQEASCLAEVNNQHLIIAPGLVDVEAPSWRERLAKPAQIDGYAVCRPAVVIAFLAAMEGVEDTSGSCLTRSPDTQTWLLVPGSRNRAGECTKTICDRVNVAREDGEEILRRATTLASGQDPEGVSAIAQSTGAMLVSGKASLIAQALGSGASLLGTALATPAVAAAGLVTVSAVGGAVYICKD